MARDAGGLTSDLSAELSTGLWFANIGQTGPFAEPAQTGTVSVAATGHGRLFDPAVTSSTGDARQIAVDPALGDLFRAGVVEARRQEVRRVIARGISRGDLRRDADAELATDLLVGPVYFRLMFGGELNREFAERVVESVQRGYQQPRLNPRSRPAPHSVN